MPRRSRVLVAAGAVLLLGAQGVAVAAAHHGASAYRQPIADYKIGDPGVIQAADGSWVVLATGSWRKPGTISTAPTPRGPWTSSGGHLLTGQPAWSSTKDKSVWAPSETRIGSTYVVFYAAIRKDDGFRRCIGTGTSASPTGPFTPRAKPIVCTGHGASDPEPGVRQINSTIDATPAWLTVRGQLRLFLTYKTQHTVSKPHHYYSTVRMVRLDPATYAASTIGHSKQLTVRPDNIEENPVMVQRGSTFTLFTSLGGYTKCTYHSVWRQSTHLWTWPSTGHRLSFPAAAKTCANGDAQVVPAGRSWRIFFSGRYPARSDSFKMYVGKVAWPNGTPRVTALLRRAA